MVEPVFKQRSCQWTGLAGTQAAGQETTGSGIHREITVRDHPAGDP